VSRADRLLSHVHVQKVVRVRRQCGDAIQSPEREQRRIESIPQMAIDSQRLCRRERGWYVCPGSLSSCACTLSSQPPLLADIHDAVGTEIRCRIRAEEERVSRKPEIHIGVPRAHLREVQRIGTNACERRSRNRYKAG